LQISEFETSVYSSHYINISINIDKSHSSELFGCGNVNQKKQQQQQTQINLKTKQHPKAASFAFNPLFTFSLEQIELSH